MFGKECLIKNERVRRLWGGKEFGVFKKYKEGQCSWSIERER